MTWWWRWCSCIWYVQVWEPIYRRIKKKENKTILFCWRSTTLTAAFENNWRCVVCVSPWCVHIPSPIEQTNPRASQSEHIICWWVSGYLGTRVSGSRYVESVLSCGMLYIYMCMYLQRGIIVLCSIPQAASTSMSKHVKFYLRTATSTALLDAAAPLPVINRKLVSYTHLTLPTILLV